MGINALKDAIKALAQSLQVPTIFPSAIFILANFYFILPKLGQSLNYSFDFNSPNSATAMVSLTLVLSYTLYAFNFALIRLFEGYKFKDELIFQGFLESQRQKHKDLQEQIDYLKRKIVYLENNSDFEGCKKVRARLSALEYENDTYYPDLVEAVLPTKLGNTIAAFEDYSRTRYGMDSIALWVRLVPILKDTDYIEFVTQEKSVFDFLLNTCFMVFCLGVEVLYLNLYLWNFLFALTTLIITLLVCYVLYKGMIIAARHWGTTVRVAFDLYRHKLYENLGLIPVNSFEKEFEQWQEISRFFLYRPKEKFKGFLSQVQMTQ